MSRGQQLLQLAQTGLRALIALVLRLEAEVRALRGQLQGLKDRLALHSRNSSKPPASDGLAKPAPKSLRTRTGRRPGGQPGHPGRTLQPVPHPDHIRVHELGRCPCGQCPGRSLRQEPVVDYEKRPVFELPPKALEVTEHRAEVKRCPVSGCLVSAPFPEGVRAPAQYGPRFQAQMVYLNQQPFIPWAQELSRLLLDCLQRRKTQGVLDERAFKKLLAQYHAILQKGRRRHPRREGGGPQGKAANLLNRLEDFEWSVLVFTVFAEVPVTNNQGEQDIRMEKVRQKISGCFRTLHGARVFARVRSYISTCRKQQRNILNELESAILGNPFILKSASAKVQICGIPRKSANLANRVGHPRWGHLQNRTFPGSRRCPMARSARRNSRCGNDSRAAA